MIKRLPVSILLFVLISPPAFAQSDSIHPILASEFTLTGGIFFPNEEFKISVHGETPRADVDFNDAFKVSRSESTGAMNFRWRFGEKWSLAGQYWSVSDVGKATLEEDVEWRDVVLEQGTFAKGEVGVDIARIFFGRKFSTSPKHEFGAGLGAHWLKLSASVEGQVLTNLGDTEHYRDSVSSAAPLPNLGAWYTYAFSPRWAITAKADWLSVSFDEYSGSLLNAGAGIDWAIMEHFGVGLSYNYFKIDVDVKKSDWKGSTRNTQQGPFLYFNATW